MKMAGRRDVGHIARGADRVHRLLHGARRGRVSADGKKRPRAIHPAQRAALAVEVVFRVIHRHAHEVVLRRVAQIDEEIVDGKAVLLDHCAHLGETGILVPSAALMKVREREKRGGEEDEFET